MKTNFLKLTLLALVLFTASCSNDDDKTPEAVAATATNIPAPQTGGQGKPVGGEFTKFSFSENKVVTTDKWDIAFRGTFIIVNGGAKVGVADEPARTGQAAVSIVSGTFSSVTTIPDATTFTQDANASYAIPGVSGQGWYDYANMIVTARAGKVFVIKTHDGKYAKVEFLSYYKDSPAVPTLTSEARFYTFNFVYQANSTTTF